MKRERVQAGTILIEAGGELGALTMIHSGLAELLDPVPRSATGRSVEGRPGDGRPVEGRLRRVGLIKGESLCGITNLRESGPASRTVRAITDCVVSNVPMTPDSLAQRLYSDVQLNVQALQGLVQRVESAIYLFRNYRYLWHKLASVADSIALAFDFGSDLASADQVDRSDASLAAYSAYLRQRLAQEKVDPPGLWDPNVLVGSVQDRLALYREHDEVTLESLIDQPQFLFQKRLLAAPGTSLADVLSKDEPATVYMYQFLERTLDTMIGANVELVNEVERLLDQLFDAGGWVSSALDVQSGTSQEDLFTFYLAKTCYRFHKDVMNLLGRRLASEYPIYERLGAIRRRGDPRSDSAPAGEDLRRQEPSVAPGGDPIAKYTDLTAKLLEFSGLTQKECTTFTDLLEEFRSLKDRLGDDSQARRVREELTPLYWKLYESCFLKVINTDLKSFVPGIMLHFGVVDEKLLSKDDLIALDHAYARALYTDDVLPVMTLPYFLEKIYRGEQHPSMTEMGETFAKRLKSQTKLSRRELDSVVVYEDTPEDRVRFELQTIAPGTGSLLFGSRRRAFPILCSDSFPGDAERLFLEPEEIARRIEEIRSRDFTLFFRDVGLRHKYGTDIIRKEVVPNFVLYPVAGSRMMMWQELDGTSRHTAGRVFLPFLFTERFDDALLTALAQFRWELQKTIAGANWMDPVDGGVVGAYYDYINFYQKNPNLTPEAKERVRTLVNKTRSDRDRFTADYVDWIRYEYDGKIRLNPVARDIFYRYCPFPKGVRETMARKPLYADLERKYQNRTRQDILKLETRLRRFERAQESAPEELARHLEMLRS